MGTKTHYDVIIIGGGVVGTAILRALSRLQLRTMLLEKAVEIGWGTTKANSGIVHAGFHSEPGLWKTKLSIAGNRMFDRLCDELDVPFWRNGLMMVARTQEEENILRHYYQQGLENGVTGMEMLDGEAAHHLEPNLAPEISLALRAPSGAVIAPFELAIAQAENAIANGAEVHTGLAVTDISHDEDRFIITTDDGDTWTATYLVNSAGLFADDLARICGLDVTPIIPRKGEEYLFDQRVSDLVTHTIFPVPTPTSKGILVIPTAEGNLMIGPTALELPHKNDLATTAQGFDEIFSFTQKLVPRLNRRDIIASFAGIRAGSPTGDFIFETSHGGKAVHLLGIESPGLTAAPAIAEHVCQMLAEAGLPQSEKPEFNPRRPKVIRFKELSDAQKEQVIRENPLYAHVVCRCETITEGEIVDAIHRGARTVDGVKFRTRAGMGRCQGGFCTPHVVKILARELGVSPLEITKRGNGSRLLVAGAKEFLKGGKVHD
ncbi:MAG: NAD(P)/FAD-dependent oxidoreductase [Firmicutes bacterium]|nr:NAD(P)/FAD-dependent oxidoreductase [Bacillota bacterium]